MRKRIHVNQHIIKANRSLPEGERLPPLSVKTYQSNTLGNKVKIVDKYGSVLAEVIYSPDKPLSCGATCWVETEYNVEVE